MIKYILLIMFVINSYAGLLDFYYVDKINYNKANALYKQKKYKEALNLYSTIQDKELEFKKLFNMGNSLAHLGKTDQAIKSYEDALKIKDDADAKFNIELLKKEKQKQQQKKKNKQDKKKSDKQKNSKDQKNKDNQNKQNKQKDKKQSDKKDKQDKGNDKENKQAKKEKAKEDKKQKQKVANAKKQPPISNMEERKWQKMLNNRGVNTLMLPIKKGENKNETNPW